MFLFFPSFFLLLARGRSLPYISPKPSSYDRKNHLTREAILKRADNSLMHFRTNGENISPLMAMLRKDLAAKFQAALDRKSNHENLAQKENRTENNDFDEQDSKQSSFDTIRKKSSLESSFNEDKAENSLKLGFEENTLTPQSNSEKISNNKIEDYKENQLTTKHPHKTFSVKKETSSEKLPQINYKLANLSIKNQPEGKITSTKIHNDLSNPAKITDGENKISKSHQTDEKRKTPTGIMRSKTEVDGSFFVKRSVSFSSDLERIRVMTPIVKYNYSKHERCSRVRKPRNSRTSQSSSSKPI